MTNAERRAELARSGYSLPAVFFPADEPAGAESGDALPENFPARAKLLAAGLTTLEAVRAKTDEELGALEGIGPATVREIHEALEAE